LTEEQGLRFEQQERALGSKKQLRKKEEKRVSEVREQFKKEVERNPRVGELLGHTQRFIVGWPRYADEHKGVPKTKLWLAYVANDPTGAASFGATVDPAEHLPRVVNGCLTPCRLCNQVQPLGTRQSVWARTQRLWEQAERAREQEERTAVAKAAKAKAEAAQEKRRRKAEAREKRKAEEATRPVALQADAEARPPWLDELFGGNERELRSVLRA
jgi:hypothetical protein